MAWRGTQLGSHKRWDDLYDDFKILTGSVVHLQRIKIIGMVERRRNFPKD